MSTTEKRDLAANGATRPHGTASSTGGRRTPIPITAAREIAHQYNFDQVIVLGRRVGVSSAPEHVTTYGRNRVHCDVAAKTGNFLKHKIMGWPEHTPEVANTLEALAGEIEADRDLGLNAGYYGNKLRALAKK